MKTPVEKIKSMINDLPAKDIPYATEFIETRDFESLSELVKSSIKILIKKKDESLEEQIDLLRALKAEIDSYLLILGLEDNDIIETDFWGGEE